MWENNCGDKKFARKKIRIPPGQAIHQYLYIRDSFSQLPSSAKPNFSLASARLGLALLLHNPVQFS